MVLCFITLKAVTNSPISSLFSMIRSGSSKSLAAIFLVLAAKDTMGFATEFERILVSQIAMIISAMEMATIIYGILENIAASF